MHGKYIRNTANPIPNGTQVQFVLLFFGSGWAVLTQLVIQVALRLELK